MLLGILALNYIQHEKAINDFEHRRVVYQLSLLAEERRDYGSKE
jgi:hypothetical protein